MNVNIIDMVVNHIPVILLYVLVVCRPIIYHVCQVGLEDGHGAKEGYCVEITVKISESGVDS